MKKMRFLLVLLVGISIVSCTNDLDEMLGTQNLQTRSVDSETSCGNRCCRIEAYDIFKIKKRGCIQKFIH